MCRRGYMSKKGMEISTVFVLAIMVIASALLFVLGFKVYKSINEEGNQVDYVKFHSALMKDIENQKRRYGSPKEFMYTLPPDVKYVLFLDLDRREDILNNPELKNFPLIKDAIADGVQNNLFIIRTDGEYEGFDIGGIILNRIGDQNCTGLGRAESVDKRITLQIKGKGGEAILGEDCEELYYEVFRPSKEFKSIIREGGINLTADKIELAGFQQVEHYRYTPQANFSSPLYDMKRPAYFNTISFRRDVPIGTDILFQFGSSPNPELKLMNFTGPDGTNETYYTYSGQPLGVHHHVGRYFRFKAFFYANKGLTSSPSLSQVTISYFRNESS